jgi:hypothetical protein
VAALNEADEREAFGLDVVAGPAGAVIQRCLDLSEPLGADQRLMGALVDRLGSGAPTTTSPKPSPLKSPAAGG